MSNGKAIFIEDRIAENLKGVCDHKATYLVRFNYGSVNVEEVFDAGVPDDSPKYDSTFDSLSDE